MESLGMLCPDPGCYRASAERSIRPSISTRIKSERIQIKTAYCSVKIRAVDCRDERRRPAPLYSHSIMSDPQFLSRGQTWLKAYGTEEELQSQPCLRTYVLSQGVCDNVINMLPLQSRETHTQPTKSSKVWDSPRQWIFAQS